MSTPEPIQSTDTRITCANNLSQMCVSLAGGNAPRSTIFIIGEDVARRAPLQGAAWVGRRACTQRVIDAPISNRACWDWRWCTQLDVPVVDIMFEISWPSLTRSQPAAKIHYMSGGKLRA
jgi:pyruvate/2-oxoglutarate/acetoin dehydrogenase E1 component